MKLNLDHRQLADEMEIFFLNEQIGAGLPVWLPNGVAIRDALEEYIKKLENLGGYDRVCSPHIAKKDLYEKSGHLKAYKENMFPSMNWPDENSEYYLRPMNCPHHHKVFSNKLRSYRNLPLRLAEYGQVYRFENSGSLKGLIRARSLCQNDSHIYLDPAEASQEISSVLSLHLKCYKDLGLSGYSFRLSKCDPQRMSEFDGDLQQWLICENVLRECLLQAGLEFNESVGDAAFYGPKIDIQMPMANSSEESVASIQLDFNSAEKFELEFINASGEAIAPWIIHRAPLGSHERFVAMLLEFYQGQLPAWLSPIQLYVIPINEAQIEFAKKLQSELKKSNIRVAVDEASGSLSKRIALAHRLRPFAKLVIGQKEVESGLAKIEFRNESHSLELKKLAEYLNEKFKHSPR